MTLSRSQTKQEKEINIQVVVRCRGRNDRERRESSVPAMDIAPLSGREITLRNGVNVRNYTFDRVFGPQADQKEIYDNVVQPILDEVLQGYNCTIFAYGQTGTGKTYTMEGDLDMQMPSFADSNQRLITSGLGSIRIPTNAGIIPRTLYQLFKAIGNDPASMVTVSYMELYNEEFRDLFVDTNAKGEPNGPHIQVFDTGTKGNIQFQGLEEKRVQTAEQAIALMRDGSLRRRVAATRCNDTSSRSHAIFTINVLVRESALGSDGDYVLKRGKLNLVDLAGSENIGRSGAENMRAREAGQINQSLLTLGRVITCLVEKHQHIPYRDSKLTRVLKDSLGGKTRTCLIATVSPSKASIEETIKTLDYAGKAKSIKNKPAANRTVSKADIIIELTGKINRLEDDLNAARDKMGFYVSKETYDQLVEDSKSAKMRGESWQNERVLMEDNLNQLNDENRKLKEKYEEMEDKLSEARNQLVQTQQDLENARQDYKNQIVVSKAHAMHEEELDEAARTLHSSLSAATRDSAKLHAKISRMQEREQLNLNAVARIGSLVGEETSRALSSVAEYSKQAGAQTQQLLATLHDRVGEQFETEIRTKLSEAESRLAAHLAELAEKAEESGVEQRDTCVASIESVSELVAQLKVTMAIWSKSVLGLANKAPCAWSSPLSASWTASIAQQSASGRCSTSA
ncbi:kinesin-domain-containing protein [Linderina pennispora]|uniref:Kinesin-like protein n=1 Tax=Linderina pennispora TaxID=61395 RepID=A0A1Y1WHZ9_9FUNG|nr:kinesin-domain-containing protein [Linderina pennispora]ORX72985.1 kinesin-domain-containing protein [Linderina pennispora]